MSSGALPFQRNWSAVEDALTVADYFVMLGCELRGERYSKTEHNRNLQKRLNGRSAGAIEFKHANISAVLYSQGFPFIDGYKPRGNYQLLLREEIEAQLEANPALVQVVNAVASAPVAASLSNRELTDILVDAPVRKFALNRGYENPAAPRAPLLGVDYAEREARNRSLGDAGEEFVMEIEDRRLRQAGRHHLANRIEHVSRTQGDGLGYDIVSFELDGMERLIEVKTTSFGAMMPFFASRREVTVSSQRAEQFRLYRVFKFREAPKLFVLPGALELNCILDPVQYRAQLP